MRDYRTKNPDIMKRIDLKKRFGITLEEFNAMLESQNFVCKICGLPESIKDYRTKTIRHLAVDHCHKTKKVRGLLCSNCNRAIGLLQDSPKILQSALDYVSKQ